LAGFDFDGSPVDRKLIHAWPTWRSLMRHRTSCWSADTTNLDFAEWSTVFATRR